MKIYIKNAQQFIELYFDKTIDQSIAKRVDLASSMISKALLGQ
jgi:hypothetical protein